MSNIKDIAKEHIEELVEPGSLFVMHVTGYSMLPLLGYGDDRIVLRRTTANDNILGRIAMFRAKDGHIIVHRVMSIEGEIVTLRGDGNIVQYEHCQRSEIIGVVERVIRQSGREVECGTRWWRLRERIWLGQPTIIRRYALAVIRRWCNFKRRFKR